MERCHCDTIKNFLDNSKKTQKPQYRTIIAGSREGVLYEHVLKAVSKVFWKPSVVLSGTARGADLLGELFANKNNIPVEQYPANWDLYGKSAGYRRNEEMATHAEALIALWDSSSRGTGHMIEIAKQKGLYVFIGRINNSEDVPF